MADLVSIAIPIATFAAGTIVPLAYRYFVHEGLAIRYLDIRVATFDDNYNELYLGFMIRVANASDKAILFEDLSLKAEWFRGGIEELSAMEICEVGSDKKVYFPLQNAPSAKLDVLPIIVKGGDVKVYAIQIPLRIDSPETGSRIMSAYSHSERVDFRLRVNGKYRGYKINYSNRGRVGGYFFQVGTSPTEDRPDPSSQIEQPRGDRNITRD